MADLLAPVDRYEIDDVNVMPSVERRILYRDLDWSPLATLLIQANGVETVTDQTFRWPEAQAVRFSATLTGALSGVSAGTKQSVTFNVGNIVVNEIWYHAGTKQQLQVTDVTSHPTADSTTAMVRRIPISLPTLATSGAPTLVKMSDQITTGGWYPLGKGTTPTWIYNYTQIFVNTVTITKTEKKIENWYGNQFQKDLYEANQQHKSNLEANLWWGIGFNELETLTNEEGHISSGTVSQSQGIDSRIQTHSTSYPGALSEDRFNTWLNEHVWPSRNSGPKDKLLICGPGFMQAINSFAVNRLHTLEGASQYGLNIREYITWGGRSLSIMEEKHFYDNPDYANTAYSIEPDMINVTCLGGFMTETGPMDFQKIGRDMEGIYIRTECGWKIKDEAKHAKLFQM